MTLAEQRFARSDLTVREAGYRALIQALGVADALRFVKQLSPGHPPSCTPYLPPHPYLPNSPIPQFPTCPIPTPPPPGSSA